MVDPCTTTIVNNFANSTYNRVIRDMTTSVKNTSPDYVQFWSFMDSVSMTNSTSPLNSVTTGSLVCGPRVYTLDGNSQNSGTWLTLNVADGSLSA
jgi:hypothetical protein